MAGNNRLPFVGRIFWKVLLVVVGLLLASWFLIPGTGYEITSADYGGSSITALILSYLVHLWLLPGPDSPPNDD